MIEDDYGCTFSQLKENEREVDEMLMEEPFSLQSGVRAIQDYSARESSETLVLCQDEAEKQVLWDFLLYDHEKKMKAR